MIHLLGPSGQLQVSVQEQVAGRLAGQDAQRDALLRFLHQLVAHGRLAALPEIARLFALLRREAEGVLQAQIRSAFKLSDARVAQITERLKRKFNKQKVVATVVPDPDIIGGIMVVAGDDVVDGSVGAQIGQLRSALRFN